MKKIIIIGTGIGGSGVGALIAKESPHEVKIFEKNDIIGGRCASYFKTDSDSREWLFDVGCHIFSTCDKGPLGEILQRCGKRLEWSYTKNPGPRVSIMGIELSGITKSKRRKKKSSKKKKEKKNFMKFCTNTPVKDASQYNNISLIDMLNEFYGSTGNQMEKIVYSMQAGVMFGCNPQTTSAGEFIRCTGDNARKMSMGYPIGGGTGIIPEKYVESIQENRGKLYINKEGQVNKVIVDDNKVKGIEAGPDNKFYEADIVISNSDIKTTILKLVGKKYFKKEYIKYVEDLEWGGQVCSIKVGLDEVITDQKMLTYVPKMDQADMQGLFKDPNMDFSKIEFSEVPSKTALLVVPISNHDPKLVPKKGFQNIHAVAGTGFGKIIKWSTEDEKKWKQTCYDTLLSAWPEIEDHTVITDFISTRYLESRFGKEGAGTGTAQSIEQVGEKRPSMVSPIEGLYYCSGDAGGWGIGTELPARSALELWDYFQKEKIL